VNWLWFGGLVMALGGAAAAWPSRRRRNSGDNQGANATRNAAAVKVGAL